MLEKFQTYFTSLERLSSRELDRSAEKLVAAENTNVAKLIAHLAEMSARKTALELGYKNIFDYCVRRLNLSEGAVPARVHVANVSRRFPQLLAALAESRISLTVASLLAAHLTPENVDELISDCAGKTRKATEEYLVAIRPKPVFQPSIRKTPAKAVIEPAPAAVAASPPKIPETRTPPPVLQPARPEEFNFRFSAAREFKEKFERLAEVLGVENAPKNMAEILEKAIDVALEKKDPKQKLERRRKREMRADRSNDLPKANEPTASRYIPSEVSERVHERAGYQCEHRGPDATRCTARTGLQIDHIEPFAVFRRHDERTLRLLCRAHNQWAAERFYGREFIQRKIDEKRQSIGHPRKLERHQEAEAGQMT